jgi:hypothetical protein
MLPTFENLAQHTGHKFILANGFVGAANEGDPVIQNCKRVIIREEDSLISIDESDASEGDFGMWVPYYTKGATWGVVSKGEKWAGSGPFSGCILEVGLKKGELYIAHLAQESGSKAVPQWEEERPNTGCIKKYRWKVSFAKSCKITMPAIYVFLTWNKGIEDLQKIVVFVQTPSMGGTDGKILEVRDPETAPLTLSSFEESRGVS